MRTDTDPCLEIMDRIKEVSRNLFTDTDLDKELAIELVRIGADLTELRLDD